MIQGDIKKWFDHKYKTKGFRYLRPLEAYEIFATLLEPGKGSKHLDVACGLGLMLRVMGNEGAEAHGIDISTEAIKQAELYCPEAFIQEGNAEDLPYESDTFDSITCIGSFERMLDRKLALKEQYRVAKSGARICYMVRNSEHYLWKYLQKPLGLYNRKGHQDALNMEQWGRLFEECGFNIQAIHHDHWPYYRTIKTLLFWKKINTAKVRRFPYPLNRAYELIFLLTK